MAMPVVPPTMPVTVMVPMPTATWPMCLLDIALRRHGGLAVHSERGRFSSAGAEYGEHAGKRYGREKDFHVTLPCAFSVTVCSAKPNSATIIEIQQFAFSETLPPALVNVRVASTSFRILNLSLMT